MPGSVPYHNRPPDGRWSLGDRLKHWAHIRHEVRLAQRVLGDPANLQLFVCGRCPACQELAEFRMNERRRYW